MSDKITTLGKIDSLERRVHRLTVDSVTKLLKKEGVIDRVLEEDENITEVLSGPVAVISIDFDEFKEVNDNFGHKMGDVYLRDISSEIDRYAWGEGDEIGFAFRSKEGDEIVVVLSIKDHSFNEYKKRVTEFTDNLNNSLKNLGRELLKKGIDRSEPTLSMGAVFEPSAFASATSVDKISLLLDLVDKKADIAVYDAKNRKDSRPTEKLADITFYENLNV